MLAGDRVARGPLAEVACRGVLLGAAAEQHSSVSTMHSAMHM